MAVLTLTVVLPTPPLPALMASTLRTPGISWRPGQPPGGGDVGVPRDLDRLDAGHGADHRRLEEPADLVLERARRGGQDDAHVRDRPLDAQVAEHAELQHRPAQLRIHDGGERLLEHRRRRGVTHSPSSMAEAPEAGLRRLASLLEWRVMLSRDVLRDLERQVGTPHVYTRPADLAAYAYDAYGASGMRRLADAVVFPASTDEVAGVVAVCAAHGVAVTPRGAGTGYAGGASADGGVILNLCRMTAVHALEAEAQRIAVRGRRGHRGDPRPRRGRRVSTTRPTRARRAPRRSAATSPATPPARTRCATGPPSTSSPG